MVEKNNFDKTLVYDAYLDKDTKATGLEKKRRTWLRVRQTLMMVLAWTITAVPFLILLFQVYLALAPNSKYHFLAVSGYWPVLIANLATVILSMLALTIGVSFIVRNQINANMFTYDNEEQECVAHLHDVYEKRLFVEETFQVNGDTKAQHIVVKPADNLYYDEIDKVWASEDNQAKEYSPNTI